MNTRSCVLLLSILSGGVLSLAVLGSASSSLAQQQLSSIPTQSAMAPQQEEALVSTETGFPQEPEPLFPTPTCWSGLRQLDKVGNLESFRAALQQAIASDDFLLTAYLRERLADFVEANPKSVLDVVASFESAQGEELLVLPDTVKQSAAARAPQVVEQLLTTAETHADPQHRIAALRALETEPSLNRAQLDRLAALGKEKTGGPVALAAVRTIGRVMENDYERSEEYMERLLDIAQSQTDFAVASRAVEMGADAKPVFGEVSFQKLADLLLHHPSKDVRGMVGLVITSARDTDAVLKVFQQAFRENDDFCSRWNAIRYSVTAAGAKALPSLKELADIDPRFQPDYLDYKELYDSGMVDYAHVYHAKKDQHEECSGDND